MKVHIDASTSTTWKLCRASRKPAGKQKLPAILQVSKGARLRQPHHLVKLEAAVLECPEIPIVLHLDLHGPDSLRPARLMICFYLFRKAASPIFVISPPCYYCFKRIVLCPTISSKQSSSLRWRVLIWNLVFT